MHRRQFLRATGSCALAAGVAGCTWFDDEAADASATVVEDVPATDPAEASPDVEPDDSEAVAVPSTAFEERGANEFAVSATVENESDRAFDDVGARVRVFDANEQEDSLLDSRQRTADADRLASGETWTFTTVFDGVAIGTVDYYAVTARATFAS